MHDIDEIWRGLIGGNRAKKLLHSSLENHRISHNYLFEGPIGTGKFPFSLKFARSLICGNPQNGLACGECEDCRLFDHGRHPDALVFSRETGLMIDEARQINDLVLLSPQRAKGKVVIIENVDRMNVYASNALLKTLEESPGKSVFILLTHRPEKLLPTILSRSLRIPFTLLSPTELSGSFMEYFGLDNKSAMQASELSGGRPGWGIRFLLHPEFGALYEYGKNIVQNALFTLPLSKIFHKEELIHNFLDKSSEIFSEQDNVAGMDALMLRKILDGEIVNFNPVNIFQKTTDSDTSDSSTGKKKTESKPRHIDALGFVLLGGIYSGMVARKEITQDPDRNHKVMEAFIEAPRNVERNFNRDLIIEKFVLSAHGSFGA